MARCDAPVRSDGPDGEPTVCPRCHCAQVEHVSETGRSSVTYCRPCEKAKARYARWVSLNRERRRASQRAYERRGRTPMADPPGRPSVRDVRMRYQTGPVHDEAVGECLLLVEAGLPIEEAVDAVLGIVTVDELRAALDELRARDDGADSGHEAA